MGRPDEELRPIAEEIPRRYPAFNPTVRAPEADTGERRVENA